MRKKFKPMIEDIEVQGILKKVIKTFNSIELRNKDKRDFCLDSMMLSFPHRRVVPVEKTKPYKFHTGIRTDYISKLC